MRPNAAFLTVITLAVLFVPPVAAQPREGVVPPPSGDTVLVTGEHVIRAAPDRAWLTLVTETRAPQPRPAQAANAKIMAAVQAQLKAAGIAEAAMATRSLDLQPEYDYRDGRQEMRGYLARNVLEVRLDDIARVGEVADLAVAAGATRMDGLRFDLQKREALEREALGAAVKDALARGAALAAGAGRALGPVMRIEEQLAGAGGPRPMRGMAMMAEAAAPAPPPTPVQAGEIEVRAAVSVLLRLQ